MAETVEDIKSAGPESTPDFEAFETPEKKVALKPKQLAIVLLAILALVAKRRRRKNAAIVEIAKDAESSIIPDRVQAFVEEADWRTTVAGAAGIWLILRLAQIRQLRRIGKAIRKLS